MPLVLHSTRNSVYPEYLPIVKKSKVKVCNIYVITRLILSAQRTERHPSASHLKPIKKRLFFLYIKALCFTDTKKQSLYLFNKHLKCKCNFISFLASLFIFMHIKKSKTPPLAVNMTIQRPIHRHQQTIDYGMSYDFKADCPSVLLG
jgi:hypothetical protein